MSPAAKRFHRPKGPLWSPFYSIISTDVICAKSVWYTTNSVSHHFRDPDCDNSILYGWWNYAGNEAFLGKKNVRRSPSLYLWRVSGLFESFYLLNLEILLIVNEILFLDKMARWSLSHVTPLCILEATGTIIGSQIPTSKFERLKALQPLHLDSFLCTAAWKMGNIYVVQ